MRFDVDTFITIGQGLVSLGLAAAGLFVTTRPVHAEPRRRRVAEGIFSVFGIALLVLIGWQAFRANHERKAATERQTQSDARVEELKGKLDQIGSGVGAINTNVSVLGKSPLPVTIVADPHANAAGNAQPTSPQRPRLASNEHKSNVTPSIGDHATGSIITQNQSGGSNTVNLGPPKRRLSESVRAAMIQLLKPSAGTCVAFASTQSDVEAAEFKTVLMGIFGDAGWAVEDRLTFMFFGEEKGVVITLAPDVPNDAQQVRAIVAALTKTDNPLRGNRGNLAEPCGIFVQVWHAP